MREIQKIAEGAYFVLSYSEQTIAGFQPGITTQTVISAREEVESQTLYEQDDMEGIVREVDHPSPARPPEGISKL